MKPHKISTQSDNRFKKENINCLNELNELNELKFCEASQKKLYFKPMQKVKNKKDLFLKKIFFKPLSISKQKSFGY